jgi:hypothetical protein
LSDNPPLELPIVTHSDLTEKASEVQCESLSVQVSRELTAAEGTALLVSLPLEDKDEQVFALSSRFDASDPAGFPFLEQILTVSAPQVESDSEEGRTEAGARQLSISLTAYAESPYLSEGEAIAQDDADRAVTTAVWRWLRENGGAEAWVSARLRYDASNFKCIVPLPVSAASLDGAFTSANGVVLTKLLDDAPSGPVLYEVSVKRWKGLYQVTVLFLSRLFDEAGAVSTIYSRALEVGGFAMRASRTRPEA